LDTKLFVSLVSDQANIYFGKNIVILCTLYVKGY